MITNRVGAPGWPRGFQTAPAVLSRVDANERRTKMSVLIRKGRYDFGDIVYNFDGKYIREGRYDFGDILFNID